MRLRSLKCCVRAFKLLRRGPPALSFKGYGGTGKCACKSAEKKGFRGVLRPGGRPLLFQYEPYAASIDTRCDITSYPPVRRSRIYESVVHASLTSVARPVGETFPSHVSSVNKRALRSRDLIFFGFLARIRYLFRTRAEL